MPLTQLERDLEKYALDKLEKLMRDVVQAFAIGGLHKGEALPLLGAMFLRCNAQIAVALHCPKDKYLARAGDVFDQETARNQRHEEREHAEAKQAQAQAGGA